MSRALGDGRAVGRYRRLLVVAFHYPPDNTSTGVLRTWKFTRYLLDFGWRSTVLSVPVERYPSADDSFAREVPAEIRVHRVPAPDLKEVLSIGGVYPDFLCIPDRFWPWYHHAIRHLRRLARPGDFDAVFATYPMATALLIGARAARLLECPLVADFRDPWVEDSMSPLRRLVEGRLERRVIATARRVICNTPAMRRSFLARYPAVAPEKFVTITNGYDEADLSRVRPRPSDRFEIIHPGLIDAENRDPMPLLRAVRVAFDNGWLDPERTRVRLIGTGPYGDAPAFRRQLAAVGLGDRLEILSQRMPYLEALGYAAGSDVLVVLSEPLGDSVKAQRVRAWSAMQVPAKVYEYLRMGRPILALVSGGAVAELLDQTQGGTTVAPGDVPAIARALGELYRQRTRAPTRLPPARPPVQAYERRALSQRLAEVLETLVGAESA